MCAESRWAWVFVLAALSAFSRQAQAQGSVSSARTGSANSVAAEPRVESLELEIGEQRVISSDGVQSYSEGGKGVVDVRLTKDGGPFVIVGLHEGNSTLLFLMKDGTEQHYKIRVIDPSLASRRVAAAGSVAARDNIRLDFYFVQLNRTGNYKIGFGFPAAVSPSMTATFDLSRGSLNSATAVISNQALPRLDMGQASGWAKVLRQAAVVTANGEKASFAGGGEVNVLVQSAMTTGVQKIPYGSQIDVAPVYDSKSGRIELHLHADVSELESDGGTGVPGRMTSSLDTIVNLELGQSLILGGLTAKSERSSKAGLPILSQIPILGALFGSHSHTEMGAENVVLIVPSVVDTISMQDRSRLEGALKRYNEYSGDIEEYPGFVPPAKAQSSANAKGGGR